MLVCHIGLRGTRRTITSDIAESGHALDALTTSNIVFATIVDDPANVNAICDAYYGTPIIETASASATFTAGLAYAVAIVEAAHAAETVNATRAFAAAITEAASAAVTLDGILAAASSRSIVETMTATDAPDATLISVARDRLISAARFGGSAVVRDSGMTQIISNIGVVS